MAKFIGKLGFSIPKNLGNGKWVDEFVEKPARGDILNQSRKWKPIGEKVIDDVRIDMTISVVINNFVEMNKGFIRYVEYKGARWAVSTIKPNYPRLEITLGGLYNG